MQFMTVRKGQKNVILMVAAAVIVLTGVGMGFNMAMNFVSFTGSSGDVTAFESLVSKTKQTCDTATSQETASGSSYTDSFSSVTVSVSENSDGVKNVLVADGDDVFEESEVEGCKVSIDSEEEGKIPPGSWSLELSCNNCDRDKPEIKIKAERQ